MKRVATDQGARQSHSRLRCLHRCFRNGSLYLMMLPGMLFFLVYRYWPMYGLSIAFRDFRIFRGIGESEWIGLLHFEKFFSSPFFSMILANTLVISLMKLLIGFPIPIILSLMLNEVRHHSYRRTVQTVVYMPYFLSWVVIAHISVVFLGPHTGVIPNLIRSLTGHRIDMLLNPDNFRMTLVLTQIWQTAGWGTIIYLAALSGVDPSLHEAAMIDGATRLQRVRHINMPSIMPVVIIMFLLQLGAILNAGFQQIFVMQNPRVYEVSEIIDTYVYKVAFQQGQYSLATAAGLFKSVIGFGLVVSANYLVKKVGGEGFW